MWDLVQQWKPSQVSDHERKYQSELQEFPEERLNGGGGMGFGMGVRTIMQSVRNGVRHMAMLWLTILLG